MHPIVLAGEGDVRAKRLAGKLDRVLVDAPCSGFGTLRRNPDLKWRHGEGAMAELAAKQARILNAAAKLLKPGGRLVYATCSILPEENEAVVDAFRRGTPGIQARCPAPNCWRRSASRSTPASTCGSGRTGTAPTASSPRLRAALARLDLYQSRRSPTVPKRRSGELCCVPTRRIQLQAARYEPDAQAGVKGRVLAAHAIALDNARTSAVRRAAPRAPMPQVPRVCFTSLSRMAPRLAWTTTRSSAKEKLPIALT